MGARRKMRVLIAHNRYQQSGGEDIVVAAESDMLRAHGHTVDRLNVEFELRAALAKNFDFHRSLRANRFKSTET